MTQENVDVHDIAEGFSFLDPIDSIDREKRGTQLGLSGPTNQLPHALSAVVTCPPTDSPPANPT